MNRADKLLAVLRDGREHSRQDVFDAHGFMLTNNAASELRARGHNVEHRRRDGLDVYRLVSLDAPPVQSGPTGRAGAASSEPSNPGWTNGDATDHLPVWDGGPLAVHPDQPALFEAA